MGDQRSDDGAAAAAAASSDDDLSEDMGLGQQQVDGDTEGERVLRQAAEQRPD